MSIVQVLRTIPLYINYFFKVTDQHALQAPFIFNFYSNLIQGMKTNVGIDEIEEIRKSLLKDNSTVRGVDLGAGSRVGKSSEEKTIADIARHGISSKKECIFLSELVKMTQPKICIELGTSLGVTTSYLAKSSEDVCIYTFEGNDILIQKATEVLSKLKCENVQIILGDIDEELPSQLDQLNKVDLALIDANHTGEALLRYFNLLKVKMNSSGIIIVDDIRWSVDMYRAWKKVISDESVSVTIEFLNSGLLFFERGIQKQQYILSY